MTDDFNGTVAKIYFDGGTAFFITSTNHVYSLGNNTYGQLGIGSTDSQLTPQDITSSFDGVVTQITPNYNSGIYAFTSAGRTYAWGNGYSMSLDDTNNKLAPQDITSSFDGSVTKLSASGYNTFAIASTGKVYSWGYNGGGSLGVGKPYNQLDYMYTPTDITSNFPRAVDRIVTGQYGNTSFALSSDGDIYAWGANGLGQLGTGGECTYNEDAGGYEGDCHYSPTSIASNFNFHTTQVPAISKIKFGDTDVTDFQVLDDNTIKLTVPAHVEGKVDTTLTSTDGTTETLSQSYTYVDDSPANDDNSDPGKLIAPNTGWHK